MEPGDEQAQLVPGGSCSCPGGVASWSPDVGGRSTGPDGGESKSVPTLDISGIMGVASTMAGDLPRT